MGKNLEARNGTMNARPSVPGGSGPGQGEVDWAEDLEGRLLGILLLLAALPWGLYAWGTIRSLHLVPALLSVFVSVAGCMATARVALIPAKLLLRFLLARYRRARR